MYSLVLDCPYSEAASTKHNAGCSRLAILPVAAKARGERRSEVAPSPCFPDAAAGCAAQQWISLNIDDLFELGLAHWNVNGDRLACLLTDRRSRAVRERQSRAERDKQEVGSGGNGYMVVGPGRVYRRDRNLKHHTVRGVDRQHQGDTRHLSFLRRERSVRILNADIEIGARLQLNRRHSGGCG